MYCSLSFSLPLSVSLHIQISQLSDLKNQIFGLRRIVFSDSFQNTFEYKLDLVATVYEITIWASIDSTLSQNYWLERTNRRLLIVSGERSSIVRKRGNSSDVCGTRSTRRQTIRKIMKLYYDRGLIPKKFEFYIPSELDNDQWYQLANGANSLTLFVFFLQLHGFY